MKQEILTEEEIFSKDLDSSFVDSPDITLLSEIMASLNITIRLDSNPPPISKVLYLLPNSYSIEDMGKNLCVIRRLSIKSPDIAYETIEKISNLIHLQDLTLNRTRENREIENPSLEIVNPSVGKLRELKKLALFDFSWREFPSFVVDLPKLTYIAIDGHKIMEIPKELLFLNPAIKVNIFPHFSYDALKIAPLELLYVLLQNFKPLRLSYMGIAEPMARKCCDYRWFLRDFCEFRTNFNRLGGMITKLLNQSLDPCYYEYLLANASKSMKYFLMVNLLPNHPLISPLKAEFQVKLNNEFNLLL